jgi:hypothetical protein
MGSLAAKLECNCQFKLQIPNSLLTLQCNDRILASVGSGLEVVRFLFSLNLLFHDAVCW